MNEVPAKITKKIQTLDQIVADLRQGEHFRITRLTMLKSLFSDPQAAAKFALYIAKKPIVEDIADFWGQHFLGRTWRKRLAK